MILMILAGWHQMARYVRMRRDRGGISLSDSPFINSLLLRNPLERHRHVRFLSSKARKPSKCFSCAIESLLALTAMQTGAWRILFLVLIPLVLGQTWERHETLDRDGIVNLFWTPDLENGEITFQLHAKTQGWAGLGFSANGAMPGSDIVVGWIKDGQTHFTVFT